MCNRMLIMAKLTRHEWRSNRSRVQFIPVDGHEEGMIFDLLEIILRPETSEAVLDQELKCRVLLLEVPISLMRM